MQYLRPSTAKGDELKAQLLEEGAEGSNNNPNVSDMTSPTQSVTQPDPWAKGSWRHTMLVAFYFFVWYMMNIYYNIWHKQLLNVLDLPWTVACLQLGAAPLLFLLPVWGFKIRPAPILSASEWWQMCPIGAFHMVGHATTAVALGAGAVSFTHVVKASEPVFTCIGSAVVLKSVFRWQVYATLIPIIAGVSLASLKELDFAWLAFGAAMTSNVARAARAIFSKVKMNTPPGENMTPANIYAVVTILSFLCCLPVALALEGYKVVRVYQEVIDSGAATHWFIWRNLILSGLMSYQEVTFMVLAEVHPITHAIGNVFKRVFVIGVSILVFGNPVSVLGAVGCSITILGTLLYSLAKLFFKNK